VGDADDRDDVAPDVVVAAGLEGADVDDHVQLHRSLGQRAMRLEDFCFGLVVAVREADDRTHRDLGAGQQLGCSDDVDRPDADRRDRVARG
jgi:hypothetical protein